VKREANRSNDTSGGYHEGVRCQQKQILSAVWREAEGPTLASARSFHERLEPNGFKSVSDTWHL